MKIFTANGVSFVAGLVIALGIGQWTFASTRTRPRAPGWTEGYEWGRLNCGRYGTYRITNQKGCLRCCFLGHREHSYPAGEDADCNRICNRAVWL